MPLQTRDLVMVALGVLDDEHRRPNHEQPVLADGIHLRWSFKRLKGFPWHGYYLFRRVHLPGNPVCLSSVTKQLQKGPWPRKRMVTHIGQVSSDADLALTRAFKSSPSVEFDLDGKQNDRTHVRFDFPEGQPARLVTATIGFRPSADETVTERECVSLGASGDGVGPNPRKEPVAGFVQPLTFAVKNASGNLVASTRVDSVEFDGEILSALNCGVVLEISLPCASSVVDLVISQTSFPATITAFNQDGSPPRTVFPQVIPQGRVPVTLNGSSINRIVIQTSAGQTRLHDICFVCAPSTGGPASDINVTVWSMDVPVSHSTVTGRPGEKRELPPFEFDLITAVEFSQGPAVLIDLCFVPVAQDATTGWKKITGLIGGTIGHSSKGFSYPMCLPVAHPHYKCANAPASEELAATLAKDRILYGSQSDWEASLHELHETLSFLVDGGPSGTPMAKKVEREIFADLDPEDLSSESPRMTDESPLDTVLMASLNPAFAQMIGLYWADDTAELFDDTAQPNNAYDYLIVADYEGSFSPFLSGTASGVRIDNFDNVDGYIVFNAKQERATPLASPNDVRSYSLPGAGSLSGPKVLKDSTNNAGLLWDLGLTEGNLLRGAPCMYHVWRADIAGMDEPANPPASYGFITRDKPVVVTADLPPEIDPEFLTPDFTGPFINFFSSASGALGPERSSEWPPFRLHFIDSSLPEGWYSYQVSSVDIFGRFSARSLPAKWFQWQPAPEPPPWYYKLPAGDKSIHDFAVHLLDKSPPPPPTAIEAWALDPADSLVVKDDAYNRWWQALTSAGWYQALTDDEKNNLIGLRVRWQWTEAHRRQAPDTKEFRIYYHPDQMNALIGRSLIVSAAAGADSSIKSVISTDIANTQPTNSYRGLWIQVGSDAFPIDGSEPGSPLRLTVMNIGKDKNITPRAGQSCTIAIPDGHPRFLDYSASANWAERLHVVGYEADVFTPEQDAAGNESRGIAARIALFTIFDFATVMSLDHNTDLSDVKHTVEDRADTLYLYLANDISSLDKLYRIISVDDVGKIVIVAGFPKLSSEPSSWIIGQLVHKYEVLLPDPAGPVHAGLPMDTPVENPIKHAHIGVSAADDKIHTNDNVKWASGAWGSRPGNEGRVGAPAGIFRVRRELPGQPRVPAVSPDSDRVFATRPDYYGHSFYTHRWQPGLGLKTHIYRALDDTLFNVDWAQRQRTPQLDPNNPEHSKLFPGPPAEPRWDADKIAAIAGELNALDALRGSDISKQQALEHYNSLSNDALRVLAGLPGNERAFSQLTVQPLDPDDPLNANRLGPDNPDSFIVDGTRRAYVDTLDGRSTNRYFYRSADVDAAHNISPLSLSSLAVYLADDIPPAKPRLIKVLGGDRQITLQWAAHLEPAMKRYLIHRAGGPGQGRDIRLMGNPVADLPAAPLFVKGGVADLGIGTDITMVERVYDARDFNPESDLLTGQSATQYLAAPVFAIATTVTGLNAPDHTQVIVVYRDSRHGLQYTPFGNASRVWTDHALNGARTYYYRVIATRTGTTGTGPVTIYSPASELSGGRAVDLTLPDPPTWTRAEWIRVDEAGNEFRFEDPIPTGEMRVPAVALAWQFADPDLAPLIQQRRDHESVFTNLTTWLPRATSNYIVRGLSPHIRYRFRLCALSSAGNRNQKFDILRLDPIVIV